MSTDIVSPGKFPTMITANGYHTHMPPIEKLVVEKIELSVMLAFITGGYNDRTNFRAAHHR